MDEFRNAELSPVSLATVLEKVQLQTRTLQSPVADSPIQELGMQEDARMIPASQVDRSDRVIM